MIRVCQALTILLAAAFLLTNSPCYSLELSKHSNDSRSLNAILLRGEILQGDTDRLNAYILRLPQKKTIAVYMDSAGGNLFEGMTLGRFFHSARIKTSIEGNGAQCVSACALAFLGGRDTDGAPWRSKSSTSALGFHSFRTEFDPSRSFSAADMAKLEQLTQRVVLEIADYLHDIGTDLSFLRLMFRAPSNEMNFISNDEALSSGIKVWDEFRNSWMMPARNSRR